MARDVDEDWVSPGAICPGKQAQTARLTPIMANFLQGSVTKAGGTIKKAPGRKKAIGKCSRPSSSARGGGFAAKNVDPDVVIDGKRSRGSTGV